MSSVKLILVISLTSFLMSGCSHTNEYNFYTNPPATNNLVAAPVVSAYYPYQMRIYDYEQQPKQPFIPIGEVTVTKKNAYGFRRQEARIKTLIREESTAMGGDAVVMLPSTDDNVYRAEVIKYVPVTENSNEANNSKNIALTAETK